MKTPFSDFSGDLRRQTMRLSAMRFSLYLGGMSGYFIGVMGTLAFSMGAGVLENVVAVGLLNLVLLVGNSVGGALLDRLGPRVHFRISVALLALSSLAFVGFAFTTAGVWAASAFFGFAWGVADLVARSYSAHLTGEPDELKRINATMSLMTNVSTVAGPLIGGAIAVVAPTRYVLLFTAACALTALIPGHGFHPLCKPVRSARAQAEARASANPNTSATGPTSAAAGIDASVAADDDADADATDASLVRAGASAIASSPALSLLFWSTILCFLGFSAFDPLESLYYRDVLHVGAEWLGWLSAVVGVGGIAGTVLAGWVPAHHVNVRTLLVVLSLMGAGCLVYVGTPFVVVAAVGQFVLGVFNGMYVPLKDTLVQMHAPLHLVGRVSAAINAGYGIAGVVPLVCSPLIASVLGVQGTLVAASASVALVPCAILIVRRTSLSQMVTRERETYESAGTRVPRQ